MLLLLLLQTGIFRRSATTTARCWSSSFGNGCCCCCCCCLKCCLVVGRRFGRCDDQIRVSSAFFPFSRLSISVDRWGETTATATASTTTTTWTTTVTCKNDDFLSAVVKTTEQLVKDTHMSCYCTTSNQGLQFFFLKDVQKYKEGFDITLEIFKWVNCCKIIILKWFETI